MSSNSNVVTVVMDDKNCNDEKKINTSYISIIAPTNISTYKLLELISQWYIKFKYNVWINEKLDHIEEKIIKQDIKDNIIEDNIIEDNIIKTNIIKTKEDIIIEDNNIDNSIKKTSYLDKVLATIDNSNIINE